MKIGTLFAIVVGLSIIAPAAHAAEAVGAITLFKVAVGLAVVLGAFAVAAMVLRRAGGHTLSRTGTLRIVDALAVGARERLVLVEVDGERVLIGMSPGQMSALHHVRQPTALPPAIVPAGQGQA